MRYPFSLRLTRSPATLWFVIALTIAIFRARAGAQESTADPVGLGSNLRDGLIISGATPHRILHFTFDDGPDLRVTPLILDKLDAAGIKATFFFSASRFRASRLHNLQAAELAREVLKRGHSIGVHSVDHQRMFRMTPAATEQQLEQSEALFVKVFGFRTWLFRPPWGSHSAAADSLLAKHGYTIVLWNLCVADWVVRPVQQMLRTWKQVLAKVEQTKGHRGGVILLHDTHVSSVEAFDLVYADILNRNCQLLEKGEELYDIVDNLEPFFAPRSGRSPSLRAPAAEPEPAVLEARQALLKELTEARCRPTTDARVDGR
jgi:peptidoglycan/xylan/chitin deacetylase (PgdA/CDA1 family)